MFGLRRREGQQSNIPVYCNGNAYIDVTTGSVKQHGCTFFDGHTADFGTFATIHVFEQNGNEVKESPLLVQITEQRLSPGILEPERWERSWRSGLAH